MSRLYFFYLSFLFVLSVHGAESENKILLGSSMPISGVAGPRAGEIVKGAQIYFDKVNKAGGIHSRKVEMVVLNDDFEPKKVHDNVIKFVEQDKVFALFQIFGSAGNSAILPYVKSTGIPYVCPIAPAEFLRYPAVPNIFNIKNSFQTEIGELVRYFVDVKKFKKIALFRLEGDASAVLARAAAVKQLKARKLELHAEAGIVRNTDSYEPALKKLIAAKPDAIVVTTLGKVTTGFIKDWNKSGTPVTFGLFSPSIGGEFEKEMKDMKTDIFVSQSFPFLEPESYPIVRQYIEDSKAANASPGPGGLEGYACAALMTEVLKRTGKDLNRQDFIKAFDQLGDIDLGGLKYHFDPETHQGSEKSFLIQAKDGKLIPVKSL